MQAIQQVFKFDETERKDSLLEIVSDKYCRAILKSILHKPKTVMGISVDEKIPISTVYRRVQTLLDNNLLLTSGMITDDGKKTFLCKSRIKGIQSNYFDGEVEIRTIPNN